MNQEEVCQICNSAASKYSCPRCNIFYCSLSCYKSQQHANCSESFYRENVIQEMAFAKDEQEAAHSSQTMMDILKRLDQTQLGDAGLDDDDAEEDDEDRFEEIDSDDADENIQSLAERLGGIDLDNADAVWEQLTEEERKEFQSILESGDISQIMPTVDPWWARQLKVELIQSAGKKLSAGEKELIDTCPPLMKTIKDFKELCSKEPSPLMKFNLANILAAYALTLRYFNGDFKECIPEAVNCMISISGNLKRNAVYDSEKLAIESVCHECREEQLPADQETSLQLAQDVRQLFDGPSDCGVKYRKHFLLAALSDVHRLLGQAKKNNDKQRSDTEKGKKGEFSSKFSDEVGQLVYLEPGKVKNCIKKVEFMLSYAKDYL